MIEALAIINQKFTASYDRKLPNPCLHVVWSETEWLSDTLVPSRIDM